ncbi:MAG: phosphotransferase family protein [Rhodobacteraceae bacterium HLUCCA08]|nr:MAG: phosphotransferase family protein [Rhodobacteraceae bacterium HLUCCA08]
MPPDPIARFLAHGPCAGWQRDPIRGDASARCFERLTGPDGTAILMITPPALSDSLADFIRIDTHLRGLGLAAPEILDRDEAAGLLLVEDLGTEDFAARLIHAPQDEMRLYSSAVDVLIRLKDSLPPPDLTALTPEHAAKMTAIAWDWFAPDTPPDLAQEVTATLRAQLAALVPAPATLALRDFHAQNLIWRPDRLGLDRVGIIDFQDAVLSDPAYDLASLLHDARRDVPDDLRNQMMVRFAAATGASLADLTAAVAVLGVQRDLRILGVFSRLAQRDDKPGYLRFVPRVLGHIAQHLEHPALTRLAPVLGRALGLAEQVKA